MNSFFYYKKKAFEFLLSHQVFILYMKICCNRHLERNCYKRHIMIRFYFGVFMFTVHGICFEIDNVDFVGSYWQRRGHFLKESLQLIRVR